MCKTHSLFQRHQSRNMSHKQYNYLSEVIAPDVKRLELAVGLEDSRAQGLNPIGGQVESSEALEGTSGLVTSSITFC